MYSYYFKAIHLKFLVNLLRMRCNHMTFPLYPSNFIRWRQNTTRHISGSRKFCVWNQFSLGAYLNLKRFILFYSTDCNKIIYYIKEKTEELSSAKWLNRSCLPSDPTLYPNLRLRNITIDKNLNWYYNAESAIVTWLAYSIEAGCIWCFRPIENPETTIH